MTETKLVPVERVERAILVLRGRRVILDSDLAALYGVTVSRFNEAVKRNAKRFPDDFAFRLTREEHETLRSQIAISKAERRGGRRYLPYVFTEHGAVMAASVLNSPRAIEVSVDVVRAFVRLRSVLAAHRQLADKVDGLERKMDQKLASHDKSIEAHRKGILSLYSAIENLMPALSECQIGFKGKAAGRVARKEVK